MVLMKDVVNYAGYVRLSRDEDKEDYASIQAQKDIINDYIHRMHPDGKFTVKFFEDDNFTGYKFNRPSMTALMSDLENNKIDAVVAKDLSRIGRHNAYTLLFIDQVKSMGKFIVAIDDDYDSSSDKDDIIGIKTWYNERYIEDLSKKIRSNINSFMKNNTYVNSLPYGYIKQDGQILVDEEARPIIQKIFAMYLAGNGLFKIARYLNENNIPAPFEKSRMNAERNGVTYKHKTLNKWRDGNIGNIIKNDFYIGTKRHHKTKRDGIHGKILQTNESQQVVFENNHEPIISKEDFELTQSIIEKRKTLNYRGDTKHYNPFSGFVFCADCGRVMTARSQQGRKKGYVCQTYKEFGKSYCASHHVTEERLVSIFKANLEHMSTLLEDFLVHIDLSVEERLEMERNYNSVINRTTTEMSNVRQEHKALITQKIKAIAKNPDMEATVEATYDELEKDILRKIEILEAQVANFVSLRDKKQKINTEALNAKKLIEKILECDTVEKKNLEILISKFIVKSDRDIYVELRPEIASLFSERRETPTGSTDITALRSCLTQPEFFHAV